MLNIAGPEYDFGSVVHAVVQECEHRRRALNPEDTGEQLMSIARDKLQKIKAAYDEFGGSSTYWSALQTEVLDTAMPQYSQAAIEMNRLERNGTDGTSSGAAIRRRADSSLSSGSSSEA